MECLFCKGEEIELVLNRAEDIELGVRIEIVQHQCGYKSDISVAPDTDSAAVGIRELLETRDGLHADADKL